MPEHHRVAIVGAGQGGLSVSYFLTQAGVPHVVFDRGGIAHAWEQRWDSFCLVTPNWTVNLPGKPYSGPDPDGFMPRDEFVQYMQEWARGFEAPVRSGVDVKRIRADKAGFRLDTSTGPATADVVVVATATYQHPRIPRVADKVPSSIVQLHAEDYKNPGQLPDGPVMVVGSGQTGCQIVEDMLRDGRAVFLCVGRTGRLPRRYRGRDCISWQKDMGLLDRTPDMLETPAQRFIGDPHLTGRDGGATVSLHRFAARGVTLLGRLEGVDGENLLFGDNLVDDVRFADEFADGFLQRVDEYIAARGITAPAPSDAELAGGPSNDQPLPHDDRLNVSHSGLRSIIWATGFDFDFSWLDFQVKDEFGYPVTDQGSSAQAGLYFCGLNWMSKRKSGILYGVEEDAEIVARNICLHLQSDRAAVGSVA